MSVLRSEIERLGPWFHNLHLPGGVQTCPNHFLGDFPAVMWRDLEPVVPQDLTGWRVLDVGCNAGFYSFQLARRGAEVTGIDADERYLAQARWASRHLDLDVDLRRMQVYDLAHLDETFDLVLFLGVFYHLRYPLLGLDIVARKAERLLLFQTMSAPEERVVDPPPNPSLDERELLLQPGWPRMAFIEHELQDDKTNWWAPDRACCEALLRSTGMRILERPNRETWLCAPDRDNPSSFWRWDEAEHLSATRTGGS